jgi:hypothetical protein
MTEESRPPEKLSEKQVYNVVSDTVTGANVRWKDNLFQGIAIFIATILGAGIGAVLMDDPILGSVAGGFCGLLIGLFGSGLVLMVYRAIQHGRGKHD